MTREMLKPQLYDPEDVLPKLKERQKKTEAAASQNSKRELPPQMNGEFLRVREGNKWKPAKVTDILPSPRSYKSETERGEYRRNRRHLLDLLKVTYTHACINFHLKFRNNYTS